MPKFIIQYSEYTMICFFALINLALFKKKIKKKN